MTIHHRGLFAAIGVGVAAAGAMAFAPEREAPDFQGTLAPLIAGLSAAYGRVGGQPPVEPLPPPPPTTPGTPPTESEKAKEGGEVDMFTSPVDGQFDISAFLSSRVGFLPLAMPITEPAVGYGLAVGLTFFHSEPIKQETPAGTTRLVMPSTTIVMGAATENGTKAAALGHLGIWDEGKIRYVGAAGYAELHLDWYGKGNSLDGQSIAYTNDVLFVIQNIKFQLPGSDVFLGPAYRFIGSDSTFSPGGPDSGIPQFELNSQTSGLGVELSYDSLDQPYSPTTGVRANLTVSQQGEWIGGDFDYTKIQAYGIGYVPFTENVILGLKLNADYATDDAPFYDLPGIIVRGLDRGRYMDNATLYGEAELRMDLAKRWTVLAFGGGGVTGREPSDLQFDDPHWAGGAGFRYLIAERYGLRFGMDVAYGDGKATVYIGVGTGWVRP